MRTWWRHNRWALLALPLVVLLTWWVSGYRYGIFYAPWYPTQPVAGQVGEPLHLHQTLPQPYEHGTYDVDVTLQAGPIRPVSVVSDGLGGVVPVVEKGATVWQTQVTFTADPTTVLTGCEISLVDTQGRTTAYRELPDVSLPTQPCVPERTPGPDAPGLPPDRDAQRARPRTYTLPITFRTADSFVPQELRITWRTPSYAAIPLEVQGR